VLADIAQDIAMLISSSSSYQPYSDELKRIYTASGHFYYSYSCLVLNSFGLQNALEYSPVDLAFFFAKVYHAAMVSGRAYSTAQPVVNITQPPRGATELSRHNGE
jgi:hypothetical protein